MNHDIIKSPFTLKNKGLRFLWAIVYNLFFRTTPRPWHAWRCWLLRLFNAQLSEGCHIYPQVKIWAPWNLTMQRNACLGDGAIVYNQAMISIGENSVVSQYVHLCASTHDYTHVNFPLITQPITIEANVWIAADSFVGPGSTIATGCVVGARSVVVKDLPAWQVCVGNPCRPIKSRIIHDCI